jgi:hypothetical protein
MQKTKLGISVGLLGAALYFLGLVNTTALILLAGYVLLREDNLWLRKTAVKAVVISVSFSLLSVVITSGNDLFAFLNSILSWFQDPEDFTAFQFKYPFELETILRNILYLVENILLLILGFMALKQGSIKIGVFDNTVNKHMD